MLHQTQVFEGGVIRAGKYLRGSPSGFRRRLSSSIKDAAKLLTVSNTSRNEIKKVQ
jgi:hypothetical protein